MIGESKKAENEDEFVKRLRELYFKCYGVKLPEWQEYYMTTLYRFHKQHPNAKMVYGRYGLQIVMSKEEDDASRN